MTPNNAQPPVTAQELRELRMAIYRSAAWLKWEQDCGKLNALADWLERIPSPDQLEQHERDMAALRKERDENLTARMEAETLRIMLRNVERELAELRRDRDALRKSINNVFGGMGKTSAIWGNSSYDKGHTAGVLAALTAFDTECKRIDAALAASKADAEKEQPHGR
jgi:hypothetical protein